jgi:protein-L-isoaspartate(D-aspartate) O-methyltransferase
MTESLAARQLMVDSQLRRRGISDPRVLEAMLRVPRERFVPEPLRAEAYEDHPVPIGEGQTISQPYVVAVMLELLALQPGDKVLEVGAGSGYVTALLAGLAAEIFSVERNPSLAETAGRVILELGYSNARIILGDGTLGLPAQAPFDAILVSAVASQTPPVLMAQLSRVGRMVIPIGTAESQQLQLIRMNQGKPETSMQGAVRFVPLIAGG